MKHWLLTAALICFGSMARALDISPSPAPSTLNVTGPGVSFQVSPGTANFAGAVFAGLVVSTQAAGSAGTAVTALCPANTFALGGGCSCTGAVAPTGETGQPNCVIQGCIANGWTCQEPGGTGGACAARAICSRVQ